MNRIVKLAFIPSLLFSFFLTNSVYAYTGTDQCIETSGASENNESVKRACEDLQGASQNTRGTLWFSTSNNLSTTSGATLDNDNSSKTLYLHGLMLYVGSASKHSYAANIELRTCIPNDFYKPSDSGYYWYRNYFCNGQSSKKITAGVDGLYSSTTTTIKGDSEVNSDWSVYQVGSRYEAGTLYYRGRTSDQKKFSQGSGSSGRWTIDQETKSFSVNPKIIMDTYYSGKSTANIMVYRCYVNGGDKITSGNTSSSSTYRLGACGFDLSTITIKNTVPTPDPEPDPTPHNCSPDTSFETDTYISTLSVSPSTNPLILPKESASASVAFSYTISRTQGSGTLLASSGYSYGENDFTPPAPLSETVILQNGEQTTVSRSMTQSITYFVRKTQNKIWDDASGICIPSGSPTYSVTKAPIGVNNVSLTVFREAESLIETRSDINVSGKYTTSENISLNTKRASTDGEFTPNPTNIGYDESKNPSEPKIFAESNDESSINLNYTHYLKRTVHPNGYDAQYALDFPWSTYSLLGDSGEKSLGFQSGWQNVKSGTKSVVNNSGELDLGTYNKEFCNSISSNSTYKIGYGDGTNASRSISPVGTEKTSTACAHLYRPWNYKLSIPSVTNSATNPGYLLAGEGGATITVTVQNEANDRAGQEGNPSYSPDDTKIELFRITVGNKDDLNDKNNQLTQSNQDIGGEQIKTITSNSDNPEGRINYANGNTPGSKEVKFEDSKASSSGEVGSHVCYYARINYSDSVTDTDHTSDFDYKHGYTNNEHELTKHHVYSGLTCFTLIGFPTAQIWGGNVFSAGKIHTRVYEGSDYALGSWADYGIIGQNEVIGLASGKTLPKAGTSPIYNCQNHPLTINNSGRTVENTSDGDCSEPTSGTSGIVEESVEGLGSSQIAASRTLTKLKNIYSKTGGGETKPASYLGDSITYSCYDSSSYAKNVDCNGDGDRFRYTYSSGDLELKVTDKLPIGVTHVIYATDNITIDTESNTNLTYAEPDGGYGKLNQIPQYIIIAEKDIKIGKNVTNVNAWLIAGGELDTCKDAKEITKTDYDSETCNQSLTINGPVFANKIMLRRTAGSTQNEFTTPAEKFDLAPLSYYWAFYQASQTGRASTVYTRSLPPRY